MNNQENLIKVRDMEAAYLEAVDTRNHSKAFSAAYVRAEKKAAAIEDAASVLVFGKIGFSFSESLEEIESRNG